jgi:simple sugar transport system permease protein
LGVIPAAIFWGALRNGAGLMQLNSGISINLINIVQALVIAFVAADQIVRQIYRIRSAKSSNIKLTRGWGR